MQQRNRERGAPYITLIVAAAALAIVDARIVDAQPPKPAVAAPADAKLDAELTKQVDGLVAQLRKENQLVGLAALVMVDGEIVAASASGERARGTGVKLTTNDRFHIGSITKSVTATVIGRLVERGTLEWKSTVADCLGKDHPVHEQWQGVTLGQLLSHTSGAPRSFPVTTQFQRPAEGDERVKARLKEVLAIMSIKPDEKPGQTYRYSNVGYTIAGVLAEQKTGKSWEDLVREEVFKPLKLKHVGFGPPQDEPSKKLSQPRGHQKFGPFKRTVGVDADNTPIIGPAGTVHMSLRDLIRYGNEHLQGERGKDALLTAETFRRLHAPNLDDYAYGWVSMKENRWTQRRIIWHNGSNTMWYALLALVPERNAVYVIASNDGDIRRAESAAFEIVKQLEADKERAAED